MLLHLHTGCLQSITIEGTWYTLRSSQTKQLITHRTSPGKVQTHNSKVKYQEAILTSRKELLSDILQLLGFSSGDLCVSKTIKGFPPSSPFLKRGSEIFPVEDKVEKRCDSLAQQSQGKRRGCQRDKYLSKNIYHAKTTTFTERKKNRQFTFCMIANKICSKSSKSIVHL